MNNKDPHSRPKHAPLLDLATAVDQFIQRGGVINVIPLGETADTTLSSEIPPTLI